MRILFTTVSSIQDNVYSGDKKCPIMPTHSEPCWLGKEVYNCSNKKGFNFRIVNFKPEVGVLFAKTKQEVFNLEFNNLFFYSPFYTQRIIHRWNEQLFVWSAARVYNDISTIPNQWLVF